MTGCTTYTTTVYNDPLYTFDKIDHSELPDKGERYTRRGEYIVDISDMGPKPNEPYAQYKQRLMNTLSMQQYNRDQLKQKLDDAKLSISNLDQQLESMRQQNAEMRLAMAMEGSAAPKGAQQARFTYYHVRKGDTLQTIAQELYGTHTGWLTLYRFNRSRLKEGPNRIEVGTPLFIPTAESLPRS